MKKIFFIFIIMPFNVVLAQDNLLNLVCPIQKQYVCSKDRCNENSPSVIIKLQRIETGQFYYSRCDKQGCDKYESSVIQTNAYIEITPIQNRSSQFKISEDLSFMETVSLGFVSFIGFGRCETIPDDKITYQ